MADSSTIEPKNSESEIRAVSGEGGVPLTLLTCAAVLLSAVLMTLAARGDLWLDEIWSLGFAEHAASPWDIVTRFKNDNNHILNTLLLYLLGQQSQLFLYRLPALMSGIGALVLMTMLARRQGRVEGLLVALLAGTSYPLILYFSEARGYAPAIFFALLAFYLLQKSRERLTSTTVLLFWSAAILGILSHFTFVIILTALFCSTAWHEWAKTPLVPTVSGKLAALFAVPFIFLGVMYLTFIRPMTIGGGDRFSYGDVIGYASATALGVPDGGFLAGTAAFLCYAGVVAGGAFLLFRKRNPLWLFYVTALLLAPPLMLAVTRPQVLYFRYFVICFPFFYLLLGSSMGELCRARPRAGAWAAAALIVLMATGHATRIIPLLTQGRGNYSTALADISAHTTGPVIRVGSDHDFRNNVLLSFYARFLSGGKKLQYIDQGLLAEERPEWFITHSQDASFQPQPVLVMDMVGTYRLQKQYSYSRDSGWRWFVYHAEWGGSR